MVGKIDTATSAQWDGDMTNSTAHLQTMILTENRQTLLKVSQVLTNYSPLNHFSAQEFTRTMIRWDTLDKNKRQWTKDTYNNNKLGSDLEQILIQS